MPAKFQSDCKIQNTELMSLSSEEIFMKRALVVLMMPYPGLAFTQSHHLPDFKNFEILRSAYMK